MPFAGPSMEFWVDCHKNDHGWTPWEELRVRGEGLGGKYLTFTGLRMKGDKISGFSTFSTLLYKLDTNCQRFSL